MSFLNTNNVIEDSGEFEKSHNVSKEDLEKVLKSLNAEKYIELTNEEGKIGKSIEKRLIELTAEGNDYAQNGSPEF